MAYFTKHALPLPRSTLPPVFPLPRAATVLVEHGQCRSGLPGAGSSATASTQVLALAQCTLRWRKHALHCKVSCIGQREGFGLHCMKDSSL